MPRILFVHVLLLALLAVGCGSCDKSPPPNEGTVSSVEPPVPAPEGMLAEIVLATPNTTWSRLQKGVGGTVGILPFTFGGLVATLSGIDPNLGQEIDGSAPAYAVLAGDPTDPGYALAAKLVEARRARLAFVDSENARFTAKPGDGIVELVPKGIAPPVAVGLASGGYLVIARSSEDLKALGPYAYRTLSSRRSADKAVAATVPGKALGGKLRDLAVRTWSAFKAEKSAQDERMRKDHGGRAPDFADPQSILASVDQLVQRKLALLGDLDHATLEVEVGEDDVQVAASFAPVRDGLAGKTFQAMHVGDAAPLYGVDVESPLAVLVRDDAAARQSDATDLHAAMTAALGKRLGEADAAKLKGALADWARGRGDWMTVAVTTNPALGVLVRAPVQNADASMRAVESGVELLKTPAFKEPLEARLKVRDITIAGLELQGFARARVATVVRDDPRSPSAVGDAGAGASARDAGGLDAGPGSTKGRRISLAWGIASDQVRVALAEDAPSMIGATPAKAMQDSPFAKASLARLDAASLVVVAQPAKGDARGSPPMVLSWGRHDADAVLRLSATHGALRDLIRKQLGL